MSDSVKFLLKLFVAIMLLVIALWQPIVLVLFLFWATKFLLDLFIFKTVSDETKSSLKAFIASMLLIVALGHPIILSTLLFGMAMFFLVYNWLTFLVIRASGVPLVGPICGCASVLIFPVDIFPQISTCMIFLKNHWFLWFLVDILTIQLLMLLPRLACKWD
ncbi:MAG: hypothetical protein Q4C70_11210 [Planctomycetia bacterium]|nr:hypothetical protein [Planctomycetia bacterium]